MMLRWTAFALLLANVLFWGWSHGWFAGVGLAPAAERDPARWEQQVRPDSVRVLPPGAVASAVQAPATPASPPPTASAALSCLETEPLAAAAIESAEQALASVLPERGWIRASREIAGQWAVVIGPLWGRDSLKKKGEELARLNVSFDEIRWPGAAEGTAGVALGRYDTQAAAQAALDRVAERGVRTARVLTLREPAVEQRLRLENVNPTQAEALRGLKSPALGAAQALLPCAALAR